MRSQEATTSSRDAVDVGGVRLAAVQASPARDHSVTASGLARTDGTLVLVHGWGSSTDVWSLVLGSLGERHRVLAIDLPGHGASDALAERHSLPAMARSVLDVASQLSDPPYTMVGHSLGSAVTLTAALMDPTRVGRIVLVGPVNPRRLPSVVRHVVDRPELAKPMLDAHRTTGGVIGRFAPDVGWGRLGAALRRRRALAAVPTDTLLGAADAVLAADYLDRLVEIAAPALIVTGRLDLTTPTSVGRELAERLPWGELVELPWAGHHPMTDCPDAFLALLDGWLDRTPAAANSVVSRPTG